MTTRAVPSPLILALSVLPVCGSPWGTRAAAFAGLVLGACGQPTPSAPGLATDTVAGTQDDSAGSTEAPPAATETDPTGTQQPAKCRDDVLSRGEFCPTQPTFLALPEPILGLTSVFGLATGQLDEQAGDEIAVVYYQSEQASPSEQGACGLVTVSYGPQATPEVRGMYECALGLTKAQVDGNALMDLVFSGSPGAEGSGVMVAVGSGGAMLTPRWRIDESQHTLRGGRLDDHDGDGLLDLTAVSSDRSDDTTEVGVFRQEAPGVFVALPRQPLPGTGPSRIIHPLTVVDLDGSGTLDLVTFDSLAGTIYMGLGRGDGTFEPFLPYVVRAGTIIGRPQAADWSDDGVNDLMVPVVDPKRHTAVLALVTATRDGVLSTLREVKLPGQVWDYVPDTGLGDLDRDEVPDVVVAGSDRFVVARELGQGATPKVHEFFVGVAVDHLDLGDLDGNGALDIVVGGSAFKDNPLQDTIWAVFNGP